MPNIHPDDFPQLQSDCYNVLRRTPGYGEFTYVSSPRKLSAARTVARTSGGDLETIIVQQLLAGVHRIWISDDPDSFIDMKPDGSVISKPAEPGPEPPAEPRVATTLSTVEPGYYVSQVDASALTPSPEHEAKLIELLGESNKTPEAWVASEPRPPDPVISNLKLMAIEARVKEAEERAEEAERHASILLTIRDANATKIKQLRDKLFDAEDRANRLHRLLGQAQTKTRHQRIRVDSTCLAIQLSIADNDIESIRDLIGHLQQEPA